MWNGRDPILKERLFGLTGEEGNHGEDVKEYYYYLDSTPTHSYLKYLYKYPQRAFPYGELVRENAGRDRFQAEYELLDTGIFDNDEYFDVFVEYAKASVEDLCVLITVINRGPDTAQLHVLPTAWFRNTWSWRPGASVRRCTPCRGQRLRQRLHSTSPTYGRRWLHCSDTPRLLFTENETNVERLYGLPRGGRYFKDGINDAVVLGQLDRVNPDQVGTRCSAWYLRDIPAGGRWEIRLRLCEKGPELPAGGLEGRLNRVFVERRREADDFYAGTIPSTLSPDAQSVARQAFAGLLWSKQYYHYVVKEWLEGDALQPPPPAERWRGRNRHWQHLYNADVIAVPDKWEYPWYACWDTAFQCVAVAPVDPDFAKEQLLLFLREWYQHPNGQLAAYEWALSDVNPPVHAWAVFRVYKSNSAVGVRATDSFSNGRSISCC